MPALPNRTMRISSVAYAVDDTASEAKIGRATFFESLLVALLGGGDRARRGGSA